MADAKRRLALLTQEIFRDVIHEERPGQNRATTRRINEALRLADRLTKEYPNDPNLRECRTRLKRMKGRRA